MRLYSVKSVFATVQGEGHWLGTPAVFVRFTGCNMWSGREEDRERDAERHGAQCPRWCDTDFAGGRRMTAQDVAALVGEVGYRPLVVFTGGEPLLQLDNHLLDVLADSDGRRVRSYAVETNGTVIPRYDATRWDRPWLTMSPKLRRDRTVVTSVDELKLVYPGHNPESWTDFPARYRWLQPLDPPDDRAYNWPLNMQACVRYAADHPAWRVGIQAHKVWGIP